MASTITDVQMHWPWTVAFRHEGRRLYYTISQGGLVGPDLPGRGLAEYPIHHTPSGSLHFGPSCTMEEISVAAQSLSSELTEVDA
jgi:hypothetical protein